MHIIQLILSFKHRSFITYVKICDYHYSYLIKTEITKILLIKEDYPLPELSYLSQISLIEYVSSKLIA